MPSCPRDSSAVVILSRATGQSLLRGLSNGSGKIWRRRDVVYRSRLGFRLAIGD
jgi:hypothetical protein